MNNIEIYAISVIVATYYPVAEKLWFTLDSIINQEMVNLEIIITDDGSKDNLFSQIKNYMIKNHFENYKLISHKKNQGTVLNCYDGVLQANGDFIKLISPGDSLTNNKTLFQWVNHMVNNKRDWSFGEAIYYVNDNRENKVVHRLNNPQIISPYVKLDDNACRWNYLVHDDIVLGAATLSSRNLALHYLKKIINKIMYAEDNIYRMMMYDGNVADYYPGDVIFYECSTGISTAGDSKWRKLLRKDWDAANDIMISKAHCHDAIQEKIKEKMLKEYSSNKIIRGIQKFQVKGWLFFKLYRIFKPRKSNIVADINRNN